MVSMESWKTIILIGAVLEVLIEYLNKNLGKKVSHPNVFIMGPLAQVSLACCPTDRRWMEPMS